MLKPLAVRIWRRLSQLTELNAFAKSGLRIRVGHFLTKQVCISSVANMKFTLIFLPLRKPV
jgi:hypothetical protein